nr:DsbA family protein [Ardenticatena sp.]
MAVSSLDRVREQVPSTVEWRAFELRPEGKSGMTPEQEARYRQLIENNWPRTIEMARLYGVEMRTHRWGIDTRPAHEGGKFARVHGKGDAYDRAVFHAYFVDDCDIGDVDVLTDIAASVELDADAFRNALKTHRDLDDVLADETWAAQAGIHSVPAFLFAGRYLVSGVRPPEERLMAIEQVQHLLAREK